MKNWRKAAVAIVVVAAVFAVVVILLLLLLLPDPGSIGRRLARRPLVVPVAVTATLPTPTPTATPVPTPPPKNVATVAVESLGAKASQPTPTPTATPTVNVQDPNERRRLVTERFMDRYFSETRIESRVCDNLATSPQPFRTSEQFGKQIESQLLGEAPASATAEAVMLPVEYVLKNESVRDLITSAENAAARGSTDFLDKAQFYAQAAAATASVFSSRAEFETISAHAYKLYALARATALKPEILQDPAVGDLCRQLETSALNAESRDNTLDRDSMQQILSRNGIDPTQIDYDPGLSSAIQMTSSNGVPSLRIPWLSRVFHTR